MRWTQALEECGPTRRAQTRPASSFECPSTGPDSRGLNEKHEASLEMIKLRVLWKLFVMTIFEKNLERPEWHESIGHEFNYNYTCFLEGS